MDAEPFELTEVEQRIQRDYRWAESDPEVWEKYQGQVVVVCNQTVLGSGKDHRAARENAQHHPQFPGDEDVLVYVPLLSRNVTSP